VVKYFIALSRYYNRNGRHWPDLSVQDPDLNTPTTTTYQCANSVPLHVTDALGHQTSYGYDSIGAAYGGGTVANFLGGNSVSSLLNLGLAITRQQPLSSPPNLTGIGLGLPVNDVLRLTGGQTNPLYGSPAGTFRSAGIKAGFNAVTGEGSSIVSLAGETSLSSATMTAAEFASWVGIVKFGYDSLTVLYGGIVACSQ